MARNLLHAGHELTVYNRTREKADRLGREGARVAGSPAEACRGCEAAVSMLADDHAVEAMGLAEVLPAGAVHISSSTISTALARRLAATHAGRGQHYVGAPVFGRPEAAEKKTLIVVAAGDAAQIERCRPVFDGIGRQTFIAGGEPWQANAVKLSGNFMLASMLETFAEAYALLRKSGVDPHLFLDVMNALFASPVYANYGRIAADEQFEPAGFALKLGLKDARLVLQTADEAAAPMPLAGVIHDRLLAGLAQGQAEMDWSSIARVAARNAGL